jgi:hypothetical protein
MVMLEREGKEVSITVSAVKDETYISIFTRTERGKRLDLQTVEEAVLTFWNDDTDIDVHAATEIVKLMGGLSDIAKINAVMDPIERRCKAYFKMELSEFIRTPFSMDFVFAYSEMANYLVIKTGEHSFCEQLDEGTFKHVQHDLVAELKAIREYVVDRIGDDS